MIAIIGNSGSILNLPLGKSIDSYRAVIRFNAAPIEGFEKYVGTKENRRFVCYDGNKYNLRGKNILLYSWNKKVQKEGFEHYSRNNMVNTLDKKFVRECDGMFSKPYWKWRFLPGRIIIHKQMSSTGFKAILWVLKNTSHEAIHLFGFGESEQFHYWEPNRPGYDLSKNHNFKKRNKILNETNRVKVIS